MVAIINIIEIMSAKLLAPGLLEIKLLWHKDYVIIILCPWRHQQNSI